MSITKEVEDKINLWLNGNYDSETKNEIKRLIEEKNEKELTDAFYKDLEFGTGGLRGTMGVGTNRMNKYTVGRATQGLCNYILKHTKSDTNMVSSIAIGYDSRNNSKFFAKTAAEIVSSNGMNIYLYDDLRPISLLSYAVRTLSCTAGIVITASHNPKEYNGFKVYWNDGAQVIPPHDKNIIEEVLKVNTEDIKTGNKSRIKMIGADIEANYIKELSDYVLNKEAIKNKKDISIVYTPIHGSGYKIVPAALKSVGFTSIVSLESLQPPDGNFPTVASPNPEEPAALKIAIEKAKEIGAELVMGTDPDCDRMGCAIKTKSGDYQTLTGNQIGSIFTYYILSTSKNNKSLSDNAYVVKTIVTTELAARIVNDFNVKLYDVLTGFKWIADIIAKTKDGQYYFGFEESFGYLVNSNVRDKDAVSSCILLAEIAAYCKNSGISVMDYLDSIYGKYGFFYEETISITKKGIEGAKEINDIMKKYRQAKIESVEGIKVVKYFDYKESLKCDLETGKEEKIELPKSDVLAYILEDGTKITVRPSGTEPKIKFYFEVCINTDNKDERIEKAKEKINILKSFITE